MQVYLMAQGWVAFLSGIVLLGDYNRSSCRREPASVWPGSVVRMASAAVSGGTPSAGNAGPKTPPCCIFRLGRPEMTNAPGRLPPRAGLSFQAGDAQRPTQPPSPAPEMASHFGHASDYSWLRGQVEYSHTRKEWQLRYTPLAESDPHGGHVVLIENAHVGYLGDGQFVRVEGHLVTLPEGRGSAPYYRIESFKVLE
jgi:hypothetical protein